MIIREQSCTHKSKTHACAKNHLYTHLSLLHACVCKDVHENLFGGSIQSYELKVRISDRSELLLPRYLQNGIDFY